MQSSLFDPPASHTADPPTSQEAEDRITASGRRAAHKRVVLELVRLYPGCTAIELWARAPAEVVSMLKEPQEVRRRLVDLRYAGLVRQDGFKVCNIRGTRMVTWVEARGDGNI